MHLLAGHSTFYDFFAHHIKENKCYKYDFKTNGMRRNSAAMKTNGGTKIVLVKTFNDNTAAIYAIHGFSDFIIYFPPFTRQPTIMPVATAAFKDSAAPIFGIVTG